jgi:hypothetical protein
LGTSGGAGSFGLGTGGDTVGLCLHAVGLRSLLSRLLFGYASPRRLDYCLLFGEKIGNAGRWRHRGADGRERFCDAARGGGWLRHRGALRCQQLIHHRLTLGKPLGFGSLLRERILEVWLLWTEFKRLGIRHRRDGLRRAATQEVEDNVSIPRDVLGSGWLPHHLSYRSEWGLRDLLGRGERRPRPPHLPRPVSE